MTREIIAHWLIPAAVALLVIEALVMWWKAVRR